MKKGFGQTETKFENLAKQIASFESKKQANFKDLTQSTQGEPTKEVYQHPLDNSQSPVNLTSYRTEELF